MMELRFGDTGTIQDTKSGEHMLGPLRCTGDSERIHSSARAITRSFTHSSFIHSFIYSFIHSFIHHSFIYPFMRTIIMHRADMFDNTVTFRKADATIEFPTFDASTSGDIRFQFRTTAENGIFLQNTGVAHFVEVKLVCEYSRHAQCTTLIHST